MIMIVARQREPSGTIPLWGTPSAFTAMNFSSGLWKMQRKRARKSPQRVETTRPHSRPLGNLFEKLNAKEATREQRCASEEQSTVGISRPKIDFHSQRETGNLK